MNKFFAIFLLSLVSFSVFARPNFECSIFNDESATGGLVLSGENPSAQKYSLVYSERNSNINFNGTLYMSGKVAFTDLPLETQKDMIRAFSSSRRPGLTTGPMILFTNTKNPAESTLNIYLMPSGEIAYIQIGVVKAFCM